MATGDEQDETLTDRQRDVKERQNREAALFPGISSSSNPSNKTTEYRLPRLGANLAKDPANLDLGQDSSPLHSPDAMMTEFLGSSPTPSSSRKRSAENLSDDGPPSSPHFTASHLEIHRALAMPHDEDREGDRTSPVPDDDTLIPANVGVASSPNVSVACKEQYTEGVDGLTGYANPSDSSSRLTAKLDVFVDASTDILPVRSAKEDNEDLAEGRTINKIDPMNTVPPHINEMNAVHEVPHDEDNKPDDRSSIPTAEPPVISDAINQKTGQDASSQMAVEDEQAATQLRNEMAYAYSQQSCDSTPEKSGGVGASEKQKKRSSDTGRKRRKQAVATRIQEKSEKQPRKEMLADCVLIEARSVLAGTEGQEPHIKQEASLPLEYTPSQLGGNEALQSFDGSTTASQSQSQSQSKKRKRSSKQSTDNDADSVGRARKSSRVSHGKRGQAAVPEEGAVPMGDDDNIVWHEGPSGSRWATIRSPISCATKKPRKDTAQKPKSSPTKNPEKEKETETEEVVERTTVDANGKGGNEGSASASGAAAAPTPSGILQGLRNLLGSIRQITLRPEEERGMVGLLFESVQQVHEAGRRHGTG